METTTISAWFRSEMGQWALSATGHTVCTAAFRTKQENPHTLFLNTYDLFQFRYGHVVVVVVGATARCWRIVWGTRGWMGWGHCRWGGARCGAIAVTFGFVARRCRGRHWAGQCWAILWIAIGRQTWGETQRFGPLCQAAHHRVCVCVSIETNPKVFQIVFCFVVVWFVFAHCFIAFSVWVSCTHHKFGFYFSSISQFCTNISKLLTRLAQRTRNLLEFVFFYFAERAQSARRTNRMRRLLESNWIDAVTEQETNPHTQLRSRPAGRSRQHNDCGRHSRLCKWERTTASTRHDCILERDNSNNKEATASLSSSATQKQQRLGKSFACVCECVRSRCAWLSLSYSLSYLDDENGKCGQTMQNYWEHRPAEWEIKQKRERETVRAA